MLVSGVRVGSSRGGGRVVAGGFAAVGERVADAVGVDEDLDVRLWVPLLYCATVETACFLAVRRQRLVANARVWGGTRYAARMGKVIVQAAKEVRRTRN